MLIEELPYHRYHQKSLDIGDVDPSYASLLYVCNRFELTTEQRFWLAFIYSLTYSGASTFWIYNEFPDYSQVDFNRLSNWWWKKGKKDLLCQTDRKWIKINDLLVPAVKGWSKLIGEQTQEQYFSELLKHTTTPEERYNIVYKVASDLPSFGQFSLFLLTEALHTITPLDLISTDLDLNQAWSCRNGLCHAYDLPYITKKNVLKIPQEGKQEILEAWGHLKDNYPGTVWAKETTLCAFAKYKKDIRYIGYYLDREAREIAKMESLVPGVCWDVLWNHRAENRDPDWLVENKVSKKKLAKGMPTEWKYHQLAKTRRVIEGNL